MEEILLFVDYKGSFGSKFNSTPPYSGIDLSLFSIEMEKVGLKLITSSFTDVNFSKPNLYKSKKIIYQSSEANDSGGEYKSFIDDVLYFLKLSGAILIPKYRFFKAHSNKVFMEMLRSIYNLDDNKTIVLGSKEDFSSKKTNYEYPLVIKKSHGAQSKGVFKANNKKQLIKLIKKTSRSRHSFKEEFKELLRERKYKNYIKFSKHRNKFIIQPMIDELDCDYKVLIFNDIFFIVKRETPPNDFRASGGGYNSFTGNFDLPEGLISFADDIFQIFQVPYVSLDIAINSRGFHLIEYQVINFGTSGHFKSKKCYVKKENKYHLKDNNYTIEHLYAHSLSNYLKTLK
ncbi:MAG: ATP-grasp domain-containing protein [Crocinitomicaceae bacterium]